MAIPDADQVVMRRLAAVLIADCVGYSRMMQADELGTLYAVKALRADVLDPFIAECGGRIVKGTGDGVLAEFPSPDDAVRCALAIQRTAAAAATDRAQRLVLRIGVHFGEVIDESNDIFGDAVNLAARLEGVAPPGGISLSRVVWEHALAAAPVAFSLRPGQHLKGFAQPVDVFDVTPEAVAAIPEPALPKRVAAPRLPDIPSLAVLPFALAGDDAETAYFADGVVEEITTALAQVPRLFVIAGSSSFTYRGDAADPRRVGRELGVRYILKGSIRRAGSRLRIGGQLVDAQGGTILWSERFDGVIADIFDLQDDIASRVAGTIATRLQDAEIDRVRTKRTESLTAYDLYLRVLAAARAMERDTHTEALALVERILKLDGTFAAAAAIGAWIHTLRIPQGWSSDPVGDRAHALGLARLALTHGRRDPDALAHGGYAIGFFGAVREGLDAVERSLELNPNGALCHDHAGWLRLYRGDAAGAIDAFNRAARLSPRDPMRFRVQGGLAWAHLIAGDLDAAIASGWRALSENPRFTPAHRALAAALGHAGRVDEAREVVRRLLDLVPGLTVTRFRAETRFGDCGGIEFILDGLGRAGMPQ